MEPTAPNGPAPERRRKVVGGAGTQLSAVMVAVANASFFAFMACSAVENGYSAEGGAPMTLPSLLVGMGALILLVPLTTLIGLFFGWAHVLAACLAWWILDRYHLASARSAVLTGVITGAAAFAFPGWRLAQREMWVGAVFVIAGGLSGYLVWRIAYRVEPPRRAAAPPLVSFTD